MLSADDHFAIHRLIGLYGHIIDQRQLSRTHELFTEDAVYDVSQRGAGVHRGAEAIRELWAKSSAHPLAHHCTNIVIDEEPDGTAGVMWKNVCVHPGGTVHSTTYWTTVAKTSAGWRMTYLRAEKREPGLIPEPS